MKASIWIMLAIVVFMIFGSILAASEIAPDIYANPVFVLLLLALSVLMIVCSIKQKFTLRTIGFQVCHLGVVAILLGACIGHFAGIKTMISVPVNPDEIYNEVQTEKGTFMKLDFGMTAADFKVERYDPDYALYRRLETGEDGSNPEGYKFIQRLKKHLDGSFELEGYGRIDSKELKDPNSSDGWCQEYELGNGFVLRKLPAIDKHYLAKLRFQDAAGSITERSLEVNHPVSYDKWRFYLSSYDREQESYIVLTARRDPGRLPVIYGIWAVILGTAALCFRGRNTRERSENR